MDLSNLFEKTWNRNDEGMRLRFRKSQTSIISKRRHYKKLYEHYKTVLEESSDDIDEDTKQLYIIRMEAIERKLKELVIDSTMATE